jgi:hypothetical protein
MILWWSVVVLIGGPAPALSAHQSATGKPVEWIVIDGATQPSLLPEWVVWQNIFSGIYTIRDKRLEGSPLDSLAVTRAELNRIESAAVWYIAHRDIFEERQKKEVAMMRNAKRPAKDIDNAQRAVILEYRRQLLDHADTLLRELSDDSRVALLAYVESRKSGMWTRVAKSELEFYRQPR